jgi:hypothetical protein
MDRLFYSLVTAFIVGVNGSIHVLLIPNSRLSRKVAKNLISGFLVILQIRYQGFHQIAPTGFEQPHYTDTAWVKLS